MKLEVLLIDDDHTFLFMNKILVDKGGLSDHAISFVGAVEAYEYLCHSFEMDKYYLLLLDINMPIMDAWLFLDLIEEHFNHGNIQVIMLSSSSSSKDIRKAAEYEQVVDYIEKPLMFEHIQRIKKRLSQTHTSLA